MGRRAAVATILALLPGGAAAFTQAEIDAAAQVARQIDLVATIADDLYDGRNNDTAGSYAIQAVLIDELAALGDGLDAGQTGDDAFKQPFATSAVGTNLLAVIPGTDLADEYVMVGAHYDGLGSNAGGIRNGATDNAAGVAAVIAIGRAFKALPMPPRRSIILALWDAEEDGLAGSLHYVQHPLVPNAAVTAYLNYDIQGQNFLPSIRNTTLALSGETGGLALLLRVLVAAQFQSLDLHGLTNTFGMGRSDHVNLISVGVPTVFFTDAPGTCYHDHDDDIDIVDLDKLREQAQIGFRLAVELAEIPTPPGFVAPTSPVYNDAVSMLHVLDGVAADIALFKPQDQPDLLAYRHSVQTIVDAGSGAFHVGNGVLLAQIAEEVLDAIAGVPCNAFFPPPIPIPATTAAARILAAGALLILAGWVIART